MEKRIYEAAKNFDEVYSKYKNHETGRTGIKFKFLPQWVEKQSQYYQNEIQSKRSRYNKFQRGALVFVDFGINIGAELSNRHWAIILNKNDSLKNSKITVVPVSSKNKGFAVEIDSLIISKSAPFMRKLNNELKDKLFHALHFGITHGFFDISLIDNIFFESLKGEFLSGYSEEKAKLIYETELKELELAVKKVTDLVTHYERFDKVSYAKCENIQTISKDRIIYINNLDPCGKLKVSPETLDRIDDKVHELFIHKI